MHEMEYKQEVQRRALKRVQPRRLAVMFGRQHAGVEEDHDDDEPVERLRLDQPSTQLPRTTVPPGQRPPVNDIARMRRNAMTQENYRDITITIVTIIIVGLNSELMLRKSSVGAGL